jgi:hypothetical protein
LFWRYNVLSNPWLAKAKYQGTISDSGSASPWAGSSAPFSLLKTSINPLLIFQIPKIQKVIDYLELKGKDKKQRGTLEQALKNLAEKADLSDTTATELAIARSKIKIREK